ncbi:hypothetical protein D3C84_1123880 [compost metagenome]
MVRAYQQHHWLPGRRSIIDVRVGRRVVGQADMRAIFRDLVEDVINGQDVQPDIELGILFAERREYVVDQCIDVALADNDPHVSQL